MIPIQEEPKDLHLERLGLEVCVFCSNPTRHWHVRTNNPVCPDCSKKHKVSELSDWKNGSRKHTIKKKPEYYIARDGESLSDILKKHNGGYSSYEEAETNAQHHLGPSGWVIVEIDGLKARPLRSGDIK